MRISVATPESIGASGCALARSTAVVVALVVILTGGCRKRLEALTPSDVVRTYQKALSKGDKARLLALTYTDPARPQGEDEALVDQMIQVERAHSGRGRTRR